MLPAVGLSPGSVPRARPAGDLDCGRLFPDAPAATGEPHAVIVPGAGWRNKIYPPRLWGRVALLLEEATGLATRVVSGPGEEAMAREAARASRGRARALHAGRLAELAAVLCLMGPTDPRRSGPYAAPDSALWQPLPCSFCAKRLDGTKACLLAISPEAVAQRAARLVR